MKMRFLSLILGSNLLLLFLGNSTLQAQTCFVTTGNCSQAGVQACLDASPYNVNVSGCNLSGATFTIPNNQTVTLTLAPGSNLQGTWNGATGNTFLLANAVRISKNTEPSFNTLNTIYGGSLAALLAALPVELVSFGVKATGQDAIISWQTAMERDHAGFELLWSKDARVWNSVANFDAESPNSDQERKYQFIHSGLVKGINYYRLLQKDLDGSEELSPIKSVYFAQNQLEEVRIHPNPVSDIVTINHLPEDGYFEISLFDSFGRQVLMSQDKIENNILDVSHLDAGTYFMFISDEHESVQRMIHVAR